MRLAKLSENIETILLALFIGMGVLILSACAQVPIKDFEGCGDMGDSGAACFHSLTLESRDIPKPAWDKERFGQICLKAQAIADLKSEIEKLCSITDRCTKEEKQEIADFFSRVDAFHDRIDSKSSEL